MGLIINKGDYSTNYNHRLVKDLIVSPRLTQSRLRNDIS